MHREIECVAPDFPGSVVYGENRGKEDSRYGSRLFLSQGDPHLNLRGHFIHHLRGHGRQGDATVLTDAEEALDEDRAWAAAVRTVAFVMVHRN